jgi:hypothetical protein
MPAPGYGIDVVGQATMLQVPLAIEGHPVEVDVSRVVPPYAAPILVPCQAPDPIVPTVARFARDVSEVFEDAVMLAAVPVVFWFHVGIVPPSCVY